jgi:cystathionine beta-lyase
VRETGRRIVEHRLVDDGTRFVSDGASLEQVVDRDTPLLMLCNPHNPTGRVFERSELEAIANVALERDLVVVADEVHAELVYPGHQHIPFASLGPEVAARTITITSATNSFNIPALRCAVMHFGSPALKARFFARIPSRLLGSPSVTGVDATVAAWDEGQPWFDDILQYLHGNRDWLAQAVAAELPGVTMRVPEATYLAWLDCSALNLPISAGQFFLDRARVGLNFGETFGPDYGSFARLNFATPRPILREIVGRMADAVRRR